MLKVKKYECKFFLVANYYVMKVYGRLEGKAAHILDLNIRW